MYSSVCFTLSAWVTMWESIFCLSSDDLIRKSARAWRSVRPFVIICVFSCSVSLSKRSLLAIDACVSDSCNAICSCVSLCRAIRDAMAAASSKMLRSSRWRFSIMASSADFLASDSMIMHGTSFIPISLAALRRLSPAISSYWNDEYVDFSGFSLTVSGWMIPYSLILFDNLCRLS